MVAEIIKINDQQKLLAGIKSIESWDVPRETKTEVNRFLDELALGKVNKGVRLSPPAQIKYVYSLKVSLLFFKRPTDQISERDVEEFEKALNADRIQSALKKQPYSHATKAAIRKALKIFLRWRLGEARALRLAGWLDTREQPTTPNYLKEQEIEQLYRGSRNAEQRYAVAMLFDSGARAEEFVNIRLEDIHFPEGESSFPRVTLRVEFSKTKGRTISLYWPQSLEAIQEYIRQRIAEGAKPQDPVFNNTYGAMRMFLKRLGQTVLKKRVHPHLFRHSSATYYAPKLNRQELCYRYGWRFSSDMPDVYISRAGMSVKELDEKFSQTELGALKDELAKVRMAEKIKDDRLALLENKLGIIENHLGIIADLYANQIPISVIESAIQKRRLAERN